MVLEDEQMLKHSFSLPKSPWGRRRNANANATDDEEDD